MWLKMGQQMLMEYAAWILFNRVQLRRNWLEIRQVLPGIPTEPPEEWLAHIIVLPTSERHKLEEAVEEKLPGWKADFQALFSNPVIQQIACLGTPGEREHAILKLEQSCSTSVLVQTLKSAGVQGVDNWANYLNEAQGHGEGYWDYYVEGCYALAFAKCGFAVKLKPTGEAGPDLKIFVNGDEV
jgi:hypothetical protein